MFKKLNNWLDKPYTHREMVRWSCITFVITTIYLIWVFWEYVVCWFDSLKLKFHRKKKNLEEDET